MGSCLENVTIESALLLTGGGAVFLQKTLAGLLARAAATQASKAVASNAAGPLSYLAPSKAGSLYVHLTEAQYDAIKASDYLGKGYQRLGKILLPGFDEGRIWATAYLRDQLKGFWGAIRSISEGLDPRTIASRTRTIELTGDAAAAFSRPRGLEFSFNAVGWLKGTIETQRQFRGQLRYSGTGVISSLDGAVHYTGWQMTAFRIVELERIGIYGGGLLGTYYARSAITEWWNRDR